MIPTPNYGDKSPREIVFHTLCDFVSNNQLNGVYSDSGMSTDKKYRYILISKPRTLDGEIRVYSHKYISISYQTMYHCLPHKDTRIFESYDNAVKFLQLAFIDLDGDKAMAVPTKPIKVK